MIKDVGHANVSFIKNGKIIIFLILIAVVNYYDQSYMLINVQNLCTSLYKKYRIETCLMVILPC